MPRYSDKYGDKGYLNSEALLSFDGVDDEVNLGNLSFLNDAPFSIEWIHSTDDHVSSDYEIMGNRNIGAAGILIKDNNAGIGTVSVFISDGTNSIGLATSNSPGELSHFVFTFDPTSDTAKLYKNGTLASQNSVLINSVSVASDFRIGVDGETTGGTRFNGDFGLLRFYDKVLSAGEVSKLFFNPFCPDESLNISILGEYLPQRSYFKDAADNYSKGANSILWFDTSLKYSFQKDDNTLAANHAVLTGFLDDEIGVDSAKKLKDFYNKQINIIKGITSYAHGYMTIAMPFPRGPEENYNAGDTIRCYGTDGTTHIGDVLIKSIEKSGGVSMTVTPEIREQIGMTEIVGGTHQTGVGIDGRAIYQRSPAAVTARKFTLQSMSYGGDMTVISELFFHFDGNLSDYPIGGGSNDWTIHGYGTNGPETDKGIELKFRNTGANITATFYLNSTTEQHTYNITVKSGTDFPFKKGDKIRFACTYNSATFEGIFYILLPDGTVLSESHTYSADLAWEFRHNHLRLLIGGNSTGNMPMAMSFFTLVSNTLSAQELWRYQFGDQKYTHQLLYNLGYVQGDTIVDELGNGNDLSLEIVHGSNAFPPPFSDVESRERFVVDRKNYLLTRAIDFENDTTTRQFYIPSSKAFDMEHSNGVTIMSFIAGVPTFDNKYLFHHWDGGDNFRCRIDGDGSGHDRQVLSKYNSTGLEFENGAELWFNGDSEPSNSNNFIDSSRLQLRTHTINSNGLSTKAYSDGDLVNEVAFSNAFAGFNGIETIFFNPGGSLDSNSTHKLEGQAVFYAIWGKELTHKEITIINGYVHSGRFPYELSWVRDKLFGLWIYNPCYFYDNGGTEPEVKNIAPSDNFPHGSAISPIDWNQVSKNWTGPNVADKITNMQFVDVDELK